MGDLDKFDPPDETLGDEIHNRLRTLANVLTAGIGGDIFDTILSPSIKRRTRQWQQVIGDSVRELYLMHGEIVESLDKDEFVDAAIQATVAAIRTSVEEKREALRNAVLNSALPSAPDEAKQHLFIHWVDTMTVWHLRILRVLADPRGWYKENNKVAPTYGITGSLSGLLTNAYPELRNERALYELIAKDLYANGLIGTDQFHTMISGDGVYENHAKPLGEQFLKFITSPLGK